VMITVSLEPKWRHFAQVNIADIFMLSSKLPKQNETIIKSNDFREGTFIKAHAYIGGMKVLYYEWSQSIA